MWHLVSEGVMMLSPPQGAVLTVAILYFPPTCLHLPHTSQHRHDCRLTSNSLVVLLLACFNWVSPWSISRKMVGWCIPKPPDQMKSSVFLWLAVNWARTDRTWLTSQSRGGELESGEAAWLPPRSQRALFVARLHRLSHRRAPRPHILSSHASLHPALPHALNTSKGKHVIPLYSHSAKKAPLPPPPPGTSALPQPIDLLSPRPHSSTSLSVFLSLSLAICLRSLL